MDSAAASVADINDVAQVNINLAGNSALEMGEYTNTPLVSINNGIAAQTLTVTNGILGTTYDISKATSVGYNIDYAGDTGAADVANLSVNGAGASATTRASIDVGTLSAVETVNLATSGKNFVTLAAGTTAADIVLTGSGTNNVSITSAAATMTVDASATTGASNLINVNGLLNTTDEIIGSTNATTVDTLRADLTTAGLLLPTVTGVENLDLTFTAAANFSGRNVDGATSLTMIPVGAVAATVSSLDETVTAINIGRDANVNATGAVAIGYAAGSTSDVTLSVGATSATSNPRVTSTGATTLTGNNGALTVQSTGDAANTIGALTANNVTSLTIGGANATQALTYGAVTAVEATSFVVDASKANLTSAGAVALEETVNTVSIISGDGRVNLTGAIAIIDSGAVNAAFDVAYNVTSGASTLVADDFSVTGQAGPGPAGTGDVSVAATVTSGGNDIRTGDIIVAEGGGGATGDVTLVAQLSAADGDVLVDLLETVGAAGAGVLGTFTGLLSATGGDLTVTALDTDTQVDGSDLTISATNGNVAEITNLLANSIIDSITVSGAGTVNLFGAGDDVGSDTIINASGLTGDFNLQLGGTGGTENLTVLLGNNTSGVVGTNIVVTGAGADTVTGGTGADNITANTGIDTMSGRGGANEFTFATGDGGTARTGVTAAGANFADGDTITFGAAIDIITDFVSGTDDLQVAATGAVTNLNGAAIATVLALNANAWIRGDWASGTFTVDAAGADSLVMYSAANAAFNAAGNNLANFVVLQGTTSVVAGDFI